MTAVPAPALDGSPPFSENDLLSVGYLSKAHGIRGELVCTLTAESPECVDGSVYLRPRNGGAFRAFTVRGKRMHHGSLLLSFEGVTTRDAALLLRSHTLFVSRQSLPPLEDGELFLADMRGFAVFVVDDSGAESGLGVIEDAAAPAGQILWTIRAKGGEEILFPAVEEFVRSIDPGAKAARISPPPGLLDLYLGKR